MSEIPHVHRKLARPFKRLWTNSGLTIFHIKFSVVYCYESVASLLVAAI